MSHGVHRSPVQFSSLMDAIEGNSASMFFGPIVSLEMVTSARRARYFLLRIFYAGLLLMLLWVNYAEASTLARNNSAAGMSIDAVAQLSYQFFVTFAFAQLGAVLVLTPAMMAGAIAQERERRTIEYLFASTLTGSEIIFSSFSLVRCMLPRNWRSGCRSWPWA